MNLTFQWFYSKHGLKSYIFIAFPLETSIHFISSITKLLRKTFTDTSIITGIIICIANTKIDYNRKVWAKKTKTALKLQEENIKFKVQIPDLNMSVPLTIPQEERCYWLCNNGSQINWKLITRWLGKHPHHQIWEV